MDGLDAAIEHFRTVTALARAIGASQPQVSNWRIRQRVPVDPTPWPVLIEEATGGVVPAWRIRPDVYPPPKEQRVA